MLGGIALVVLLLKVFLVSSARVTTNAELSTEAGNSLSSDGELHTKTKSSNCDLSRYPQLEGRFENLVYAGKGANGCVVLANDKDNGNVEVAVKLSKKAGKLASWHSECEQSRSLHEKACTAGHLQLHLAERYLPICLEVGGTDDAPFMVMHAAGGKGIDAMQSKLRGEYRVSVFSQMVGALTAMHGIGLSHNDLHDGNVVILSKPGPLVAFIDFGEVETLKNANYGGGYKQDENLLARQAAKLADCPSAAQFPFNSEGTNDYHKQHTRKKALMTCLQDKWGKGEDEASFSVFLRALGAVVDEAYKHELEHGKKHNRNDVTKTCVKTLYHTAFVQKHQPPLWSLFPARLCSGSGSGGRAPDHWLPPAEDTDKSPMSHHHHHHHHHPRSVCISRVPGSQSASSATLVVVSGRWRVVSSTRVMVGGAMATLAAAVTTMTTARKRLGLKCVACRKWNSHLDLETNKAHVDDGGYETGTWANLASFSFHGAN